MQICTNRDLGLYPGARGDKSVFFFNTRITHLSNKTNKTKRTLFADFTSTTSQPYRGAHKQFLKMQHSSRAYHVTQVPPIPVNCYICGSQNHVYTTCNVNLCIHCRRYGHKIDSCWILPTVNKASPLLSQLSVESVQNSNMMKRVNTHTTGADSILSLDRKNIAIQSSAKTCIDSWLTALGLRG